MAMAPTVSLLSFSIKEVNLSKYRGLFQIKLFFIAIIIIGVILRLLFFTTRGSFVFDEYFTVFYSQNADRLKKVFVLENNPPFYYVLLYFWQKLLPVNEFNMRLFPLILSLLNLPAVFFLAKKLESKKEAVLSSVALFSISPILIFFSGFGRIYSLLSLLATIFSLSLLAKPSFFYKLKVIISGILLSLTHIFGIFIVLSGLTCQLLIKSKKEARRLATRLFLILTPVLIWVLVEIPQRNFKDLGESWYLKTEINPLMMFDKMISSFTFGINFGIFHLIVIVLVSVAGKQYFLSVRNRLKKLEKNKLTILTTIIFATTFLGMAANLNVDAYYIGIIPLVLVLTNHIIWKGEIISPWLIIFCLILIMFISSVTLVIHYPRTCWDKAAQYIAEREKPNEQILIAPFFRKIVFDYY